ncbi:sodium:calcium antiporter [Candidatus Auribacterota bacterium]
MIDNGVKLARIFKVSEKLIALTIISIGSSLPELVTSAIAAYKKRCALVVGNILGSNIFNIFLVLGISPLINPVKYDPILNVDISVLSFSSFLLFLFMFTGKKHKLDRWEAALFLLVYAGYFTYLLSRG